MCRPYSEQTRLRLRTSHSLPCIAVSAARATSTKRYVFAIRIEQTFSIAEWHVRQNPFLAKWQHAIRMPDHCRFGLGIEARRATALVRIRDIRGLESSIGCPGARGDAAAGGLSMLSRTKSMGLVLDAVAATAVLAVSSAPVRATVPAVAMRSAAPIT